MGKGTKKEKKLEYEKPTIIFNICCDPALCKRAHGPVMHLCKQDREVEISYE